MSFYGPYWWWFVPKNLVRRPHLRQSCQAGCLLTGKFCRKISYARSSHIHSIERSFVKIRSRFGKNAQCGREACSCLVSYGEPDRKTEKCHI